jgi:hypothetical protein
MAIGEKALEHEVVVALVATSEPLKSRRLLNGVVLSDELASVGEASNCVVMTGVPFSMTPQEARSSSMQVTPSNSSVERIRLGSDSRISWIVELPKSNAADEASVLLVLFVRDASTRAAV